MHSSALRTQECITWKHCANSHSETGDAETGDVETNERESERLVIKCTFNTIVLCNPSIPYLVLIRSRDFGKRKTKSKLQKLMMKSFFLKLELCRINF